MLLVRRYDLEDDVKQRASSCSASCTRSTSKSRRPTSCTRFPSWPTWPASGPSRSAAAARLEMHGLAVVNAYQYLFDARFGRYRNPYDPEFRGACDLYNGALESALRIVKKQGGLVPGSTQTIRTANQTVEVTIVLRGDNWRAEDFEEFRFVSDYEIRGLQNQYHNYGLGVPLIAVRKHHGSTSTGRKVLSARAELSGHGLSARAARAEPDRAGITSCTSSCTIPLNTSEINVDGRSVPLESDLTTPLAYALNQKQLRNLDSSTAGLLNPAQTEKLQGLYMLEPYQPGKIPVLMIHGLWSSPITWMEMFNDLRGAPEIRDRYQFWFYLYPTRPAVLAQRRRNCGSDLAEARQIIDPAASPGGARPDGAGRPQHGRAGVPSCKRSTAATISGTSSATSRFSWSRRRDGNEAGAGRHVFLSAESVGPPRDHDRHAVSRQRDGQLDDPLARQQADQAAADAGQAIVSNCARTIPICSASRTT